MTCRSRVVDIKVEDELSSLHGSAKVRVNIVYERDVVFSDEDRVEEERCMTPPPKLELEGYENEAPWVGQEVEVGANSSSSSGDEPSDDDCRVGKHNRPASTRFVPGDLYYRPRKRKIRRTNVLRFASVEELNAYCEANGLNGDSTTKKFASVVEEPKIEVDPNNDNQFVYSIDEAYATPKQRRVLTILEDIFLPSTSSKPADNCPIATCRLCNVEVSNRNRKQHVYVMHLRKQMYRCPMCSLGHVYHKGNVEHHIKKMHQSTLAPICNKDLYSAEVDVWLYKCFADRRIVRSVDPEVTALVTDLIDWTCEDSDRQIPSPTEPSRQRQSIPESSCTERVEPIKQTAGPSCFDPQQMPDDLLEPDVNDVAATTIMSALPYFRIQPIVETNPMFARHRAANNTNTCGLCGMANQRHLERHVLQCHVKRPMFMCPFCSYSNNYARNAVKDHIRVKHSLSTAEPIDMRDQHWAEIRRVYQKCFPSEHVAPATINMSTRR